MGEDQLSGAVVDADDFSLAGDAFAFQPIKTCFFCGRLSQVLCDGILAWLRDKGNPKVMDRSAKAFTCDRAMCRACVAQSGMIHFNMKPKHVWDSRDYCRDCVREGFHEGGNPNIFGTMIVNGKQRRAYLVTMADGLALQARRSLCVERAPLPPPTPTQETAP